MTITQVNGFVPQPGMMGSVNHYAFISGGIEYFTRWWRGTSSPPVSHSLTASSSSCCVEANADGVDEDNLSVYNDAAYALYWRTPWFWTPEIGDELAAEARRFIGFKYDFGLIAADALNYDVIGHLINGLTGDALDRFLTRLADSPRLMICDKLCVVVMQNVCRKLGIPLKGSLLLPARECNPQMLFCDDELYQPGAILVA